MTEVVADLCTTRAGSLSSPAGESGAVPELERVERVVEEPRERGTLSPEGEEAPSLVVA